MSKEKQIENMIEIVKPFVSGLACGDESGSCELTDCRSCKARSLVNKLLEADCGKQSEGEWIDADPDGHLYRFTCSLCGKTKLGRGTPYCPHCGAKMKGEKQ
jgi:hypothetical protein